MNATSVAISRRADAAACDRAAPSVHSRSCGTCAATIPIASAAASGDRVGSDDAGEPARLGGARPAAAGAQDAPRAEDVAAVEKPDRDQVEEVEEEAGVGEREQQVRADGVPVDEAGERGDPAGDRPGDRDEGVAPGIEGLVAQGDVRAEERDEHRQLRVQPLPARLDVVAELVDEDEEHEADAEAPAPDEGVAADRDEDAEELQRAGDLQQHGAGDEDRRQDAAPDGPRLVGSVAHARRPGDG